MIFAPENFVHILIPVAHAAEEASSSGVAGTLGINLKLFIAQLINFAILLFVLWKYAFTPIAKKLEERTSKIEKSLHDADRIEKEKREFEAWKNQQMIGARQQASAIVADAEKQAQKTRAEIAEQTKQDQQKLVQSAKTQIENEKQKALADAKSELADLVTSAAEKILRHKLDQKTDQELIKQSLKSI